jgi:hypothetical protein
MVPNYHCFGSGLDSDSIKSVDPIRIQEGKNDPLQKEKLKKFHVLLRAEGFFCSLDVLYGVLGIGKLQFLAQKNLNSAINFFKLLVIKTLDLDRYSA